MATYRQIVYMVLDEVKLISNDSTFTEEHVIFLANNYRNYLIKQQIDKEGLSSLSQSNYQTVCIDLELTDAIDGLSVCNDQYLKSTKKIPDLLDNSSAVVSTLDIFGGINIAYVSWERFRYVGYNKFMRSIIYCALGLDNYLYLKGMNPSFGLLSKIKFSGLFEDPDEASELSCDESEEICDTLDKEFPIDKSMIPQLVELCVKEILGAAYRPKDDENNSNDDLSDLATFVRQNVKSNLAKQIDND